MPPLLPGWFSPLRWLTPTLRHCRQIATLIRQPAQLRRQRTFAITRQLERRHTAPPAPAFVPSEALRMLSPIFGVQMAALPLSLHYFD
jgi:hypothetical protein